LHRYIGDAKRMGSHTHVIRGRHGKEFVNPGLVKINDTTLLEHLFIMLRRCEAGAVQVRESS
jgi:hypothetical protein